MRLIVWAGLAVSLLPVGGATPATDFDAFAAAFIHRYYDVHPLEGVSLGWHQYDGKFVVPDRAALEAYSRWLHEQQKLLERFGSAPLDPTRRADLGILTATIRTQIWTNDSMRAPWHDPQSYAGAIDISAYIKRDFKPLAARIKDIIAILKYAPQVFAAGRANLDAVVPVEYIDTAVEVANGTASFLADDVAKVVQNLSDPQVKKDYAEASRMAQAELKGFVDWLNRERRPHADHSFAIGRASFSAMLGGELVDLSPEDVLALGLAELQAEKSRFDAAAREIDPSKTPEELFQEIKADHPSAENLIPETRRNLEDIRRFVVDHHLVTIRSEVRAEVEETLPPFRATTFASMDSPGPFEKKATQAYYYVTPVERDWPAAQKEEWLSAFNNNTMLAVGIHEVYPGHYVQFLALNASHASDVSKVFGSYAYIEGWAHYCEEMVPREGYKQPADPSHSTPAERVSAAKFRLAQSAEALLRVCRLCCSVKMHTAGMSVDEATHFFMANCHYEEKTSHGEAMRGTYDPGYMFYTLGKLQIRKLRRDWQKQEGPAFTLQHFHDEFLSHGMPPIRALREEMLRDRAQWPDIL